VWTASEPVSRPAYAPDFCLDQLRVKAVAHVVRWFRRRPIGRGTLLIAVGILKAKQSSRRQFDKPRTLLESSNEQQGERFKMEGSKLEKSTRKVHGR
jgi:hypothetical protein